MNGLPEADETGLLADIAIQTNFPFEPDVL